MRLAPPVRPRLTTAGFTLLEMAIAIVLAAIFCSLLIPVFESVVIESRLRSVSSLFSRYALTARDLTVREGVPHVVEWDQEQIRILRMETSREQDARGFPHQPEAPDDQMLEEQMSAALPSRVSVSNLSGQTPAWRFMPSGLCEPMQLRISSGESWIEIRFSPLTGAVMEETYAF